MNATVAIDRTPTLDQTTFDQATFDQIDSSQVARTDGEKATSRRSFVAIQAASLAVCIFAVFAVVTAGALVDGQSLLDAVGIAAFLAFWLGTGFGFLIGGVIWGSSQEEH